MAKTTVKKNKLTREQREAIDNKIVLATAISLISAIFLMFLYRWMTSAQAAGTIVFAKVLMWIGVAGVVGYLVLYYLKKDKKYLFITPYFAAGSFLLAFIIYNFTYRLGLPFTGSAYNFGFAYCCLAIYLIASYVYYGLKLRRK